MLIAAGTILEGKYKVLRLLGAGGMGSVWVAEHTLLQRPVAVKILDSTARKDGNAVQRFLREAQTAARLRSDHIVDVLDVGMFDDGTPFLVMELLEGETLAQRIKRLGRLTQQEATLFADQLLDGLGAAHTAGVIHRDIKPDNCFITLKNGRDHLKLLDFGISKVAGDPRELRMTKTGVVMGTPYYMAPEQARGSKDIDHRCDLYAVGAILYECVAGRVPFDAESVNELLFKIVLEPIAPPRTLAPELDASFEELILFAMGREPGQRFQSAQEFRDALAHFNVRRSQPNSGTLIRSPSSGTAIGTPPFTAVGTPVGARVIVRSTPPGQTHSEFGGAGEGPVSGTSLTAPIESNPALSARSPSHPEANAPAYSARPTPSGNLGMSATGPIHPSNAPSRKKSPAVVGAVAFAGACLLGGVVWIATRAPAATTTPSSAAQQGEAATTTDESKPSKKKVQPVIAASTADNDDHPEKPVQSATATAPPPTVVKTTVATSKKLPPPVPTTKTPPAATTSVVTVPNNNNGSPPRPMDSAL